jgi:hypothetical protein
MKRLTIIEALADPKLFGALPPFKNLKTWASWLAILRAFYGLPLNAEQMKTFRKLTGRSKLRAGGYREMLLVVGRRAGKSQVAALIGAFEAMLAREGHVVLVAQDARASQRVLYAYVRTIFTSCPLLKGEILRETADTLELKSGVQISVYPCRPASVRGLTMPAAVLDEIAFMASSDTGISIDQEMMRAVVPALATVPESKLVLLTSPYGQSGVAFEMHKKHFGQDDSEVLVVQADAPTMNPSLDSRYLERMRDDDPEGYRAEVLGEFRAGLSALFDPAMLDAVVDHGRREFMPAAGINYEAAVDPSGGRSDSFTLAIGHRDRDGSAFVDLVRAWTPPFNPSGVVEEIAAILADYRVRKVVGDRYAGEWPRESFRAVGISYDLAEKSASDNYLSMLSVVNSRSVRLPDAPELLKQLRGLERRVGLSGKDRVDHRPGSHDDLGAATALLVNGLVVAPRKRLFWASASGPVNVGLSRRF